MGHLKNQATKNYIIETAELKKYTANLSNYPLPLDIAFPLFGWKVLFRDHIYKGLIENLQDDIFIRSFSTKQNGRIEILKDTLLAGYDLKKGNLLRLEESDSVAKNNYQNRFIATLITTGINWMPQKNHISQSLKRTGIYRNWLKSAAKRSSTRKLTTVVVIRGILL